MGLDINSALFLIAARKQGVNFGDVLMVGRQGLNVYPAKMSQELARNGLPTGGFPKAGPECAWAEPFFEALGAKTISSLDASDFEGARIVHDMNQPVSLGLHQKFDFVFDGGTLEHIFNFPVALQNCMEMVSENGRIVIHTPANNWCGHGFYQFSPELFYNVFSEENGFEVERMILHIVGPYGRWYEVANPQAIRARVELFNSFPLQMLVQARRTRIVHIFSKAPQQSDYTPRWDGQPEDKPDPYAPSPNNLAKTFPGLARLLHVLKIGWQIWRSHSLGNRKKFRPVKKRT